MSPFTWQALPLQSTQTGGVENIHVFFDAHGRVGSIQGLANRAGLFDEHTLHWAVRHGANAAWFAGIKARYLGTVLDVPSARKSVPRPRM